MDRIFCDAKAVPGWNTSMPSPELVAVMVNVDVIVDAVMVDVDIAHLEDQSSGGHAHRRSESVPWPARSVAGVLGTRRS